MKRRKASLPRVSILAYSRRDLERFSHAVESLSAQVLDLERLMRNLQEQVDRLRGTARRTRKAAPIPIDGSEVPRDESLD